MICLHIDLCGITHPENSFVFYPTEYQMSSRDGELMHLTAESTSEESRSLVAQTASRLPDREIKIGKKDAAETWEWRRARGQRQKVNAMGSSGDGHCHPLLSTSFDMTDGKHN